MIAEELDSIATEYMQKYPFVHTIFVIARDQEGSDDGQIHLAKWNNHGVLIMNEIKTSRITHEPTLRKIYQFVKKSDKEHISEVIADGAENIHIHIFKTPNHT